MLHDLDAVLGDEAAPADIRGADVSFGAPDRDSEPADDNG
ncbi:hypothetical protein SAMN05216215_108814 [Saccharopolyspora shandongensis]|uniref:Uncharacterized protein n=1 Tax=Saccharopolyspora shandongensis TaxID=418495 RepID=A0A1H3TRB2_9PSEU|nr:hypothetical protein SAMN05216215_108814 [Saccharopolyspora shandongensis]